MTFPSLRLTPYEAKQISKYGDSKTGKRGVLRRFYQGSLAITPTQRLPTFSFNIARRCRVMAITFAGDVSQVQFELIDVTGEKHTANPVFPAMLSPMSAINVYSSVNQGLTAGAAMYPYVIDPNIVLMSNQTLQARGYAAQPVTTSPPPVLRIDFVLHVWEFPGMEGSPQ